ncbi:endonuclease/exonuclease/phosphatase family protein [Microbacterium awajiense]|uniref:Endonuclease/exonuclease/phosphatase family protein n=1 Tax=Microbacterium awajiense TaxID=415214 RepID=A0ABP7AHY9_9MICO
MSSRVLGMIDEASLHVMTFNVRRPLGRFALRRADRWAERREPLFRMLRTERPAILGCQEVMPEQLPTLTEALGDGYAFVGHGRSKRGDGESCPLFFDEHRLELREWSQTALSDRPHEPGSRSWGNLIPRVLVTGVFLDRRSGGHLCVMNTHLDPFSSRSRVRAAEAIRIDARARGIPTVIVGDANASPGSRTARALLGRGELRDAWLAADARTTPEWGTLAGYRPPRPGARIDWIVTTPDVGVRTIGIGGQPTSGGWPSDHLPVHAEVHVDAKEAT